MATPEELQQELLRLSRSLGSAADDIKNSGDRASNRVGAVSDSLRGLSRMLRQTSGVISNAEGDFQKFDNAISAGANTIYKLANRSGRLKVAISGTAKIFETAFKSITEFSDRLNGLYDGLSSLGITANKTTNQILELAHMAGYTLKTSKDFTKLVEDTGTELLALGTTSSKGVDRLARIFNNINFKDRQEEFLRLGLGPKELNKIQSEYIKLQSTSGLALTTNDNVLRESTLEYAKSLSMLTGLTGEQRDKVAEEIAQSRKDVRYALEIQNLVAEGNQKAVKAFDTATSVIGLSFGQEYKDALIDFIANETVTTKQAEALMFKTQGRIIAWVKAVKSGEIDGVELVRRIAQSEKTFVKEQREALTFSDQFRQFSQSSGQTKAAADRLVDIKSEEEMKGYVDLVRQREDDLKKTQDVQLRVERFMGQANDKLAQMLSGVGNAAILEMLLLTKQLARGVIRVARLFPLGDEFDDALAKLETILSDNKQLEDSRKDLDKKIEQVTVQLNERLKLTQSIETSKQQLKEAEERNKQLKEEVRQQPQDEVTKDFLKNNEIELERKKREVENLKKREKELEEKRTRQQLENDKRRLETRKEQVEKQQKEAVKEKEKPTTRKEEGKPSSKEKRKPAIVGKTDHIKGDLGKFAQLDPKFQERILNLAEKYYSMTGKPLNIISSYRSEEDQLELYNAWREAGGRYPWESNPNPVVMTRFGRLYMPRKSGGQHSQGIAVDIDQTQLDYIDKKGLLDEFNLKRHKPIKQDPVHVTIKAKRGKVLTGPDSGYPVELHGTEAIIPFNNKPIPVKISEKNINFDNNKSFEKLSQMATDLRNKMHNTPNNVELKIKDNVGNFKELTDTIRAKVVNIQNYYKDNKKDIIDPSLANSLITKLETMISSVERSTSIHSDLKMYLRN